MDKYFVVLALIVCSVLTLLYLHLFLQYKDKALRPNTCTDKVWQGVVALSS